jgi:hypothetical protein
MQALQDFARSRKQLSVAGLAGWLAKLAADELLILSVIPPQAVIQRLRGIECNVAG